MTSEPRGHAVLVGLIRINQHCTFSWEQPQEGGSRSAEVGSTHCAACVEELRRLGYVLLPEDRRAP